MKILSLAFSCFLLLTACVGDFADPGIAPITPTDGPQGPPKPIIPPTPKPVSDHTAGFSEATNEVTKRFKEYAKVNKGFFTRYQVPKEDEGHSSSTPEEVIDIDDLYMAFCTKDPWALNRREFVRKSNREAFDEYMKGYYDGLHTTVYTFNMPLSHEPWLSIIKRL